MQNFFASPTRASIVLAILVLLLYSIAKDDDASTIFRGCVAVHVVVMIAYVMVYEIFYPRARVRTNSTSVNNNLIGSDALHHYVASSEAFSTRRRIQDLRLQVALLDRELDDFENLTLRDFPLDNVSGIPSMSEEEINALPVHNYEGTGLESEDAPLPQVPSSSASAKEFLKKVLKDNRTGGELTCNICLEQVKRGEPVRSLPCLHQFHSSCIDPWLGLNGTCPICKFMLGSGSRMASGISSDDDIN